MHYLAILPGMQTILKPVEQKILLKIRNSKREEILRKYLYNVDIMYKIFYYNLLFIKVI